MRLYNKKLEGSALFTICHSDELIAGKLVAGLSETCFHTPSYRIAFARVKNLLSRADGVPSWETLLADPVLTEETRDLLSVGNYTIQPAKKIDGFIRRLQDYAKLRKVYNICTKTLEDLNKGEITDLDDIVTDIHEEITNAKMSYTNIGEELFHFGKGNNTAKLIESRLNPERKAYVPTGFTEFDKRNGGFNEGSLVIIGAPTGCGKTVMGSVQLPINMSKYADVAVVPLEMTENEMTDRLLANIASIPVNKFGREEGDGGLTKKEVKHIKERSKAFIESRKKEGHRLSIWSPSKDVDMMEVLYGLLPYDYDIIVLDYISLLRGVDGEQQWKQLGAVARQAKVYAKTYNKIVILLAQVSSEGLIKYSKAISEHANNFWLWTLTDVNKENQILDIIQPKARNQDPTPFQVFFDFQYMQMRDIGAEEEEILENASDEAKNKMKRNRERLNKLSSEMVDEEELLIEI